MQKSSKALIFLAGIVAIDDDDLFRRDPDLPNVATMVGRRPEDFKMPEVQLDDFRSAWQEVFENAKLVAAAPQVPEAIRRFWAAVLRGEVGEAVALLDAMDESDHASG